MFLKPATRLAVLDAARVLVLDGASGDRWAVFVRARPDDGKRIRVVRRHDVDTPFDLLSDRHDDAPGDAGRVHDLSNHDDDRVHAGDLSDVSAGHRHHDADVRPGTHHDHHVPAEFDHDGLGQRRDFCDNTDAGPGLHDRFAGGVQCSRGHGARELGGAFACWRVVVVENVMPSARSSTRRSC